MLKNLDSRPKSGVAGFHTDKRTTVLETLPTLNIVEMIVCEGIEATRAVARCEKEIAEAAELIAKSRGRCIYVGAGTSGRLGKLDAAELPPTFGVPPERFTALMAGGSDAFANAKEGAEDNEEQAREDLRSLHLTEQDVVCGIAASGTTPYVRAALQFARSCHAQTVFITGKAVEADVADIIIHLDVGPEIIHGSTRLKAGTAQTECLKALSSAINILRKRTYGGLMVDMNPTNAKLVRRAIDMIQWLTELSEKDASSLLKDAMALKCKTHGPVKIAAVMHHRAMDAEQALETIEEYGGFLRKIIGDIDYTERSLS